MRHWVPGRHRRCGNDAGVRDLASWSGSSAGACAVAVVKRQCPRLGQQNAVVGTIPVVPTTA
jgi:hypothetical protein